MTESQEERQLLRELSDIGLAVDSVYDLFGQKLNYKDAIPLLIAWLPKAAEPRTKEGIARALSVKWAKPDAGAALVREFETISDPGGMVRWAIANALSIVADDALFDDMRRLVTDKQFGKAREMLAVALGNMRKTPAAEDVLIQLLEDEQLVGHALIGLRKLRAGAAARPRIEALAEHPKTWVRAEAKKLLKKLDA